MYCILRSLLGDKLVIITRRKEHTKYQTVFLNSIFKWYHCILENSPEQTISNRFVIVYASSKMSIVARSSSVERKLSAQDCQSGTTLDCFSRAAPTISAGCCKFLVWFYAQLLSVTNSSTLDFVTFLISSLIYNRKYA